MKCIIDRSQHSQEIKYLLDTHKSYNELILFKCEELFSNYF
jgi:hypothetical protein